MSPPSRDPDPAAGALVVSGHASGALTRLVGTLAEDALFLFAASRDAGASQLASLARRRAEAYAACAAGDVTPGMVDDFEAWVPELSRAVAPVAPPAWLPMSEVLAQGVTLEAGARGLRAIFSSKPSEKDTLRVQRCGKLAVRALRAVLAADGNIDADEARTVEALIASLGLPEAEARAVRAEEAPSIENLEVYGDVEAPVARAIVKGAWLAAAWDALDPREEHVVKTLARKLALPAEEVEAARTAAIASAEARKLVGLAAVDCIRFILSDRVPGAGVPIAACEGVLLLPRRFREEALAPIGHGAPVTLARRHMDLPEEDRRTVLQIGWAAALHDDPPVSRLAILKRRHDTIAADLADDGRQARQVVSDWVAETLDMYAGGTR